MRTIVILIIAGCILLAGNVFAQNASDYLVCEDMGTFKDYGCSCGIGSGIIAATGHFDKDHQDTTCSVLYHSMELRLGIEVQVTEHAGADSDRWLLHEVERGFRSDDLESQFEGTIKEIDGNKIITFLYGTAYRWVSNNIVVYIKYSDPQLAKPEPIEVVKAYLQKHPSTITMTDAEAKGRAHNETWIKDEMERRLWLGDKWFMQLQLEKAELGDVLREAMGHMGVFLDYREKYYGISGDEEKARLSEFLREQNGTEIKNRLEALKSWWADNKGNGINL